jgi:hypothetical protein
VPATAVVHVGGDAGHIFDESGLGPGLELVEIASTVPLVSHLGHDAGFFRHIHESLALTEGVSEGFLHVNRLSQGHGEHGGTEMRVVRGGDENGIDLICHLVEHFPEISIGLGLRVIRLDFLCVRAL